MRRGEGKKLQLVTNVGGGAAASTGFGFGGLKSAAARPNLLQPEDELKQVSRTPPTGFQPVSPNSGGIDPARKRDVVIL